MSRPYDELRTFQLGIRLYTLNGYPQHFARYHDGKWLTLCGEPAITHQRGRPGWKLEACRTDKDRVRCPVCNMVNNDLCG
jgi:hypothetical protein